MKINCVVVTYNRLALLKENLNMLGKQTYPINKIIVVDNCSTDGTTEYLKQYANDPLFSIITTEKNVGGAGGFSIGLKASVLNGCDYSWVMDDDTIPLENSVEELIPAIEQHDNIGFICSKVKWTDNSIHEMNRPKLEKDDDTCAYPRCRTCSFVGALISTKAVLKVGLPIKEFFIWCDDVEYTERIYLAGFNCYYAPKSVVIHKSVSNYFPSIDRAPKEMAGRFYFQARNTCYLKRRTCSSKIIFYFAVLNKYRVYLHRLKRRDKSERAAFLEAVKKGCIDGLKFNPQIEFVKL